MTILFFVTLLTGTLHGCNSETALTDEQYVSNAKDYWDKKEVKASLIELKNALQQNPNNPEARWLLAIIYLETGKAAAAEKELRKASDLGISNTALYTPLMKALLMQGKHDEIMDSTLPSDLSASDKATVYSIRGAVLFEQKQLDAAKQLFLDAQAVYPSSGDAMIGLAKINIARNEPDAARELLNNVIENEPENGRTWSLMGDIDLIENNAEQAEIHFSKAIQYNFDKFTDLTKRALVRISLEKFGPASQDIERLQALGPEDPASSYTQGMLDLSQKRYAEAQNQFEKTLQLSSGHVPAMFYLGVAHYLQGHNEQTVSHLQRVLSLDDGNIATRKLLAATHLRTKNYMEAEKLITPVLKALPDDVISLNILGNALLASGNTDAAIPVLEKLSKASMDKVTTQGFLGLGLLMQGELSGAIDILETVTETAPQLQEATLLLVHSYIQSSDYDKALATAQDYLNNFPEKSLSYSMLGIVHLSMKENEKAHPLFMKAWELSPGDRIAGHGLAHMELDAKNYKQARIYYEEILSQNENDLETLMKLASVEALEHNDNAVISTLERAIDAHPEELLPRLKLARYFLDNKQPKKVFSLLQEFQIQYSGNPALVGLIGEAQLNTDEITSARESLSRLIQLVPNSAHAHFLLAKAHEKSGNLAEMAQELVKTLELNPDHYHARYLITQSSISGRDFTQAQKHLDILKHHYGNKPELLHLEGELALAMDKPETAISAYKKALEKGNSHKYLLLLTDTLWRTGDKGGSIEVLNNWLSEHPQDTDILMTLAQSHMKLGQDEPAATALIKIIDLDPVNIYALNDLAWLLRKSDTDKALKLIRQAHTSAQNNPLILDTYALVLLESGDTDQAYLHIDRASNMLPDNPSIQYHKALILKDKGHSESARAILEKVLASNIPFNELPQARALLKLLE